MLWLKEHIGTVSYPGTCGTVYKIVCQKLQRLSLPVEEQSEQTGTIVVRCLSRPVNMILWQCWSDKLMIKLTETEHKTNILVYALPNLLRAQIGKGDRETKLDDVLKELGRVE